MSNANVRGTVSCIEQKVVIPTYPAQGADPIPMFLEKRVYQGSSGRVYPVPLPDGKNELVQLMIIPEIGDTSGRRFPGLPPALGCNTSPAIMQREERRQIRAAASLPGFKR